MKCDTPFLVAAGQPPDCAMQFGSTALSTFWGGSLNQYSCLDSPNKVLNELNQEDGLILLKGDAAQPSFDGSSWLESLGAWKKPVILLVVPTPLGKTPGVACAYSALCKQLSVRLIGLVQLGGHWDFENKKFDNLPWCGWLPSNAKEEMNSKKSENSNILKDTFTVTENLRYRCLNI